MDRADIIITDIDPEDKEHISHFISENWGSNYSVSKGKIYDVSNLPGFICKKENRIIGLITYHVENDECEIVTLDSKVNHIGLGTKLIKKVIEKANETGCKRVWLITTNDNTYAIGFYQKRGFEWVGFYKNAMEKSRRLKPEIPELGYNNIPIKHEIEFEYRLHESRLSSITPD